MNLLWSLSTLPIIRPYWLPSKPLGIKAGCGIKAGRDIEVGENFGIYAGLSCKITDHKYRKIIASEEPENIMCGEFKEKSV